MPAFNRFRYSNLRLAVTLFLLQTLKIWLNALDGFYTFEEQYQNYLHLLAEDRQPRIHITTFQIGHPLQTLIYRKTSLLEYLILSDPIHILQAKGCELGAVVNRAVNGIN